MAFTEFGEVLPRTGDTRHDGLTAELAISADFARNARHFRCERAQLVDHRIDGFLQLEDFAAHVDGDFLGKIAVGHRDRDLGNVANLSRQVIRHGVHVLGQVFPHTGDFSHLCLSAELTFGADFTRDAGHFRSEHAQLLDHRVDDGRGLKEFALERPSIDFGSHGLEQVALRYRGYGGCDFLRRPDQIIDQGVDRRFHFPPCAVGDAEFDAVAGFSFATDDFSDPLELLRHSFVGSDDVVEGIRDFSEHSLVLYAHSHGKVAGAHGAQRLQECLQFFWRGQVRGTVFRASTFFCGNAIGSLLVCDCRLIHRRLPNIPPSGDRVRTSWRATVGK